ncbi:MAG: hypothetical protein GY940_46940 [bacterium]|nr:hypothetical protein [bacterium]
MNKKYIAVLIVLIGFTLSLSADYLHTVDRKVYEGKMVAFKYDTIYFNVYKFDKIYKTIRFPLYKVWKIEFNDPKKDGLQSSFEVEHNYNKLRRGKRSKRLMLDASNKWLDTGIDVKIGQEILFLATGSINIDANSSVYQNGELYLNWNKKKPLPNQPTGAIIGRVGKKGKYFYVGDDKAPFQMSEKGRLFIGINDFDFKDNSGKFTVTVYY